MFGREPALVIGVIGALIALAVGFGLPVTAEQVGLINAFVIAAVSFATRTQVTPTSESLGEGGHITVSTSTGNIVKNNTIGGLAHRVEDAIEHSKERGQSAVTVLLIVVLVLAAIFLAERIF